MSLSTWPLARAWVLISASLTFAVAVVIGAHCFMPLAAQPDTSLSMMLSAGRLFLLSSKPRRSHLAWSEAIANALMVWPLCHGSLANRWRGTWQRFALWRTRMWARLHVQPRIRRCDVMWRPWVLSLSAFLTAQVSNPYKNTDRANEEESRNLVLRLNQTESRYELVAELGSKERDLSIHSPSSLLRVRAKC